MRVARQGKDEEEGEGGEGSEGREGGINRGGRGWLKTWKGAHSLSACVAVPVPSIDISFV